MNTLHGHPPLVSVALPFRNAASTLSTAIESIRLQSLPSWELLLIDDGSTDGSGEIARAAAGQDPRIIALPQPPLGLVPALQHALQHARGAYVARMDADDVAAPERLMLQAELLEARPELGVAGCRVQFGGATNLHAGYALHTAWTNTLLSPADISLNRFIDSPLPHPSVMFRRSLLATHGSYTDGPFPEDYELWLRWLDRGVLMAKSPAILLTWNDTPTRLSRIDPRYSQEALYALKARYLAFELARSLHSRQLWIWGAGRVTRRRAALLEPHGLSLHGYIDIDPNKARQRPGRPPVVLPDHLPSPTQAVVIVLVGNRGARDLIRPALCQRGYVEGRDFWCAA